MGTMPLRSEWLKAGASGAPTGVDRKARVLRGFVVAQAGPFKSDGRGEFDRRSLDLIVQLGNAAPNGLKSRFTHPDMSSDGLGKFLGRARNFSLGTAIDARTRATVEAARADLHFDPSASKTPSGDLAGYVMDLAESDPDALSSSLVLHSDKELRLNGDGTRVRDADGKDLPPLWRPKKLHATDIVDVGDAVDGILSAEAAGLDVDALPLAALWRAAEMLDAVFADQPRAVVEARCQAWFTHYLGMRFGDPESPPPVPTPPHAPDVATLRRKMRLRDIDIGS